MTNTPVADNFAAAKRDGDDPDSTAVWDINGNRVPFPLVVIGASAGGMDAIKTLVAGLPAGLEAAVLIVWHMSSNTLGMLPDVINRFSHLPAAAAKDGEIIEKGHIYVAPVDHHLMVEGNRLRTTKGPKENRFRPAIDPLFRSAAYQYGSRVVGIILSGALDDGTSGLWLVKSLGGTAIVQDPDNAEVSGMPQSAIRHVNVDYIMPVSEIAHLLVSLVKEQMVIPSFVNMQKDKNTDIELRIAEDDTGLPGGVFQLGELTPFTCPECHGVLTAIVEGSGKRFRCHTGHAFSTDSLLAALTEHIEESLWTAIRSIKESSMLMNHIGDYFAEQNDAKLAALYFKKALEAEHRARQVREVATQHEELSGDSLRLEAKSEISFR